MSNRFVERGLSAPVNITWEMTYACNLSCVHCLSDSGKKDSREPTTEQCREIIDQMAENRVFQFNIGGGEPFIRRDFLSLMEYTHSKGIVTCISTNGTLITSESIDRLDPNLTYVQVSVDGASELSNDQIRGKGSFRSAMKAIEILTGKNIEVSINTVLTGLSFPELNSLTRLGASVGAKLRVSRFRPSGRGKKAWAELNVTKEQMVAFSYWLSEHEKVSTGDSFFSISHEDRRGLGLNMCGACKLTCAISPLGHVYPCAFLQESDRR